MTWQASLIVIGLLVFGGGIPILVLSISLSLARRQLTELTLELDVARSTITRLEAEATEMGKSDAQAVADMHAGLVDPGAR